MVSTPAPIAPLTSVGGLFGLIAKAVADDMERESSGEIEETEENEQ